VICDVILHRRLFSYRGRSAVASQRQTLAGAPLAAVGVGRAAVAVGVLFTALVSICNIVKNMEYN